MKLEELVVSLELAKELKEAGFPQDSFWAWYQATDRDDDARLNRFDANCPTCTLQKQSFEEKYAAPTSAELGERLPEKYFSFKYSNQWFCYHYDFVGQKTEAEARAKMYLYLSKNNLLGKEQGR